MKKNIIYIGYDYGIEGVGFFLKKIHSFVDSKYNCSFLVSNTKYNYAGKNIEKISNLNKKALIKKIDNCDIVHLSAHNFEHIEIALIAFIRKKKIICNYHNFFYDNTSIKNKVVMFLKKIVILNLCNIISSYQIYLTNAQKKNFNKFYLFKKSEKVVIPNFIEEEVILESKEYKLTNIIYVCRKTKIKGYYDFLELSKRIKYLDFYFIGGKQQKRTNNFVSLGRLDNKNVFYYYDKSQILVFPSYLEVFPMTILEAMARGLVILASDIPGMREIVKEGINGYLFSPGDIDKIEELILYLKNNPNEIERIAKNNLKEIWNFTAEKQAPKYIKVYEEVLGQK